MSESTPNSMARRLARHADALAFLFLATAVIALPWDILQRLPVVHVTITKLATLAVCACAVASLVLRGKLPEMIAFLRWPVALAAIACVISLAVSLNRAATLSQIFTLISYVAFIVLAWPYVQQEKRARRLLLLFIASSACVAALAVCCWLGLLYPTAWRPPFFPWHVRMIEVAEAGVPMRMVASGSDLNQGVLPQTIAFAASLFLFDYARSSLRSRVLWHAVQVVLIASLVIAQSRSSILLAAGLLVLALGHAVWKRYGCATAVIALIFMVSVGTIAGVVINEVLLPREDDTVSSRVLAYRAGLELLPRYFLLGTGLGVSDRVIEQTGYGQQVDGATIHNVPLKIALETGVLGFAAYLLFWVNFIRAMWAYLLRGDSTASIRLGYAGIAVALVIMGTTLVQPFIFLAIFPVLFVLFAGPIQSKVRAAPPDEYSPLPARAILAISAAGVAAVVCFNVVSFQLGVRRVESFATALESGLAAEMAGRWDTALEQYAEAHRLARQPVLGVPFRDHVNYQSLQALVDVPRVCDGLNVLLDRTPHAQALSAYALGRLSFYDGDLAKGLAHYEESGRIEPDWAQLHYDFGAALWRVGEWARAIQRFEHTRAVQAQAPNWEFRFAIRPRDDLIRTLEANSDSHAALERPRLLMRAGRTNEAFEAYQRLAEDRPDSAEAAFHLGLRALLDGDTSTAREYFQRALQLDPKNVNAARAVAALN